MSSNSFNAGCNIVLHCNGKLGEMRIVAENSPLINKFIQKKTLGLECGCSVDGVWMLCGRSKLSENCWNSVQISVDVVWMLRGEGC